MQGIPLQFLKRKPYVDVLDTNFI